VKLEEAIKSNRFKGEKHKALINVMYSAYWIRNNLSIILKEFGVTLEQFNVLRILNGKHPEPMNVKDIASRIIEKSSNVPRIIDRLVAKKLAKRSPSKEDKRETMVSITENGINLLMEAVKLVDQNREQTINLTENEAKIINDLLEKMREDVVG
jgi:DNA-binding MarR family transcriptional regulator